MTQTGHCCSPSTLGGSASTEEFVLLAGLKPEGVKLQVKSVHKIVSEQHILSIS